MTTRRRVLTFIVAIGAIATLMTGRAPAQSKADPHQKLQAKAKAAKGGDPRAIREFTDEIFNQQTPFTDAAESLKERVSRCETLFRQDAHEPIHEKHFEKVFNEQMHAFGAPSFWKTNQSQIRVLRGHRRQLVPSFVEPRPEKSHKVSEAMGPAEAAYIVMQLAANKHFNPEFQVEPHEWDQRAQGRRRTGLMKKSGLFITGSVVDLESPEAQSTTDPVLALEAGLKSEHSDITAAAHRALDQMGFQR